MELRAQTDAEILRPWFYTYHVGSAHLMGMVAAVNLIARVAVCMRGDEIAPWVGEGGRPLRRPLFVFSIFTNANLRIQLGRWKPNSVRNDFRPGYQ